MTSALHAMRSGAATSSRSQHRSGEAPAWLWRGTTALLVGLTGGCGPTSEEMGQAVLWAAPIVTLVALGVAWGYAALWRPLVADLRFDPRPSVVAIAVELAIALATLLAPAIDLDLVLAAIYLVGASHLTLAMLALRIAVHRGSRAYSWALLAPIPILIPPAIILAVFGESAGIEQAAIYIWVFPAYGAAPIFLLALLEVLVRRARARRS
jgi:hypothetical protein